MTDMSEQVDIPNRALFKAAEVCDLAKVQPYVLRSWETEFKDLGVAKSGSSARVYRREDVERVLRIKHLLLHEGLTLAGVRRKLDEEAEPALDLVVDEPAAATAAATGLPDDTRARLSTVKQGLQSLLAMLAVAPSVEQGPVAQTLGFDIGPEGADDGSTKRETAKSVSPRRKRSA